MDTQRDSDLLEQHITSSSEVEMPAATATSSAEPDVVRSEDNVPGQPAEPLEQELPVPLHAPGTPVARTGFQASLRPYSNGQG
eukprot:5689948-Amphidinium_carterae.1